ncbi:conserved hypothetical secreted protein [Mycobacterium marinum M]|uniref:Conserved hypothetical secreted protein n=1 Tax=Mycobacterium marinum (strain ATCC BAA-535 / M) TaxID=216594 RepID=B2HRV2_MYCMM|nr:conserved hypothetical secreted protein [Mycobacterium marinum M]
MTRRRRIALATATVGATAGLMFIGLALTGSIGANMDRAVMSEMGMLPEGPVPLIVHYGAIAYAPNGAFGKARRFTSRFGAEQAALKQCGLDSCKVLINFNRCGAVAYNNLKYQGGSGWTLSAAQQDAIDRLGGGWIVNWACN